MKRLLTHLAGALSALAVLVAPISSSAAVRWTVNIYDPSATTNKTLNVRYQVLSTVRGDDKYTVELFENNISKGSQSIEHDYGDSGVFNIAIPSAGTYTYKVKATNEKFGNDVLFSAEKSVQVSNAPEPTVTTVTVNQATPANAGGGVAAGGAGGAGAAGVAGAGGQVAAAAGAQAENGAVTDQAATTDANANQDVLGAQASAQRNKNRNNIIAAAVLAVASLAGYAYYRLRVAPTE